MPNFPFRSVRLCKVSLSLAEFSDLLSFFRVAGSPPPVNSKRLIAVTVFSVIKVDPVWPFSTFSAGLLFPSVLFFSTFVVKVVFSFLPVGTDDVSIGPHGRN